MTTAFHLPKDPLARFGEIYDALNRDRGWWQDATVLRYSALTLATTEGSADAIAGRMRDCSDELKRRAGWFGPLNSSIRFVVAAMLVRNGDEPGAFCDQVDRASEQMRSHGLRRGSIYEVIALLILRQHDDDGRIDDALFERFKRVYEMMKSYHWWLTGPDDYPACALLAATSDPISSMGAKIEEYYEGLEKLGFLTGDPLQTVSHILYFNPKWRRDVIDRFQAIHNGFKEAGIRMYRSDYDEVAILTFLDHDPGLIVSRVKEHRSHMDGLEPRPDRSTTFSLACGTTFLELVRLDRNMQAITDASVLIQTQAILAAQQAAVACVAASTAAAAAASASSS